MPTGSRTRHLAVAAVGAGLLLICGLIAHNGRVGSAERYLFRAINDLPAWLYKPLWVFQQFGNLFVCYLGESDGVDVLISDDAGRSFKLLKKIETTSEVDQPTMTTGPQM